MAVIEIDDSIKWELLSVIDNRLIYLERQIAYDKYTGTNSGVKMMYDRLRKLQVELTRKHCKAEMLRGDADVIARAREAARRNGEWEEADRLRGLLIEGGWNVQDTTTGYKLRQGV
jgi:cysteinyl-tRNA synthetase